MRTSNIGKLIRKARRRRNWTQTAVSRSTAICQGRLSQIENGQRLPSEPELERLRVLLGLETREIQKADLPYPSKSWRVAPPVAFSRSEHPVQARFHAARKRFGPLLFQNLCRVQHRPDHRLSQCFLEQAGLDSGYEYLFWLRLLAVGGQACWIAPVKAGFRQKSIVDSKTKCFVGDVRHPAIELIRGKFACLFFPQPTVETRGRYYRLDALVCYRHDRRRLWVDLEIDGLGHDSAFDDERQNFLGLRTVRLSPSDLISEEFLENLERAFRNERP